jgi:tRNA pseudouridine13 synthase
VTTGSAADIGDPLPRRCFTDGAGIGGRLKERPEDFVVEEIPLYEPSGEGEHLYLRVRKHSVSHGELMSCLRRHFGVPESAVGYAGMKDKHALTSQTVSIRLPGGGHDGPVELPHDRIDVLWAERHRNKIRRGHLVGNRFSIRIRAVEPLRAPHVHRVLRELERTGAPAYFGTQRFGYRHNNHRLGALLLHKDWTGVLDELLGATGTPFPEHQREQREHYDAGRYAEAAAGWTVADRSELIAINALVDGKTGADAVRPIGRTVLRFWTSSLVSAAFNRVLDRRIEDGTVDRLLEGDLAWKHDNRAVFRVDAEALRDETLAPRLAELAVSPSGPLWGAEMPRASGVVDAAELEALASVGVTLDQVSSGPEHPDGGRRPFRTPIRNIEVEGGFDEHGPYVRVAFDLPRGAYATEVLREVMGEGTEGQRH